MRIGQSIICLCLVSFLFFPAKLWAKDITISLIADDDPYFYLGEDGKPEGMLVDYWTLWGERVGHPVTFVPDVLSRCIEEVSSGKTDVMGGLYFSEDRAAKLDFLGTILKMETILFVRSTNEAKSIRHLKVPVAVVQDSYEEMFLQKNYSPIKLKRFLSLKTLREQIQDEELDAFVYDYPLPLQNMTNYPMPEGYRKLKVIYTEILRAAVQKGNTRLEEIVGHGMDQISEEETFELAKKWHLYRTNWLTSPLGIAVSSSLLSLIMALIIFIYILRKRFKMEEKANLDLKTLIEGGENEQVEFKSTLRWDLKQQKINKALEHVIAKTIAAFLNTEGGHVIIGVDDGGTVLGLEVDYNTLSKKNSDGFLLTLTSVINKYLGKQVHRFLSIHVGSVDDKDCCIVSAKKSDFPVFLSHNNNEEFFIRASASSHPMNMREAHEYITAHWPREK